MGVDDLGLITLGGLLLHDPDDRENRRVFTFTDWDETADPEAMIVPNGSGHGARGVGTWVLREKFPTIGGRAGTLTRADYLAFRKELLAACPIDRELSLVVEEPGGTLQMFVRRHGKVEPKWLNGRWTDYVVQLFAEDPFKYGLDPLTGTVGVFTGDKWFRRYTDTGGGVPWFRRYMQDGGTGPWFRRYEQADPGGTFPEEFTVTSQGTVESDRVTTEVVGPLSGGDWRLVNESTGQEMWADTDLVAGQTLVFDSHRKTLTLQGTPVPQLFYGDWLTLPPGQSVFRLTAGLQQAGHATFEAFEAQE